MVYKICQTHREDFIAASLRSSPHLGPPTCCWTWHPLAEQNGVTRGPESMTPKRRTLLWCYSKIPVGSRLTNTLVNINCSKHDWLKPLTITPKSALAYPAGDQKQQRNKQTNNCLATGAPSRSIWLHLNRLITQEFRMFWDPPCLVASPGSFSFYTKRRLWNTLGIIILYKMNSRPFYKMRSHIHASQNQKATDHSLDL